MSQGLKGQEADDVLIIYAAAQTAIDGIGGNSPFAGAFDKRLTEPGLAGPPSRARDKP